MSDRHRCNWRCYPGYCIEPYPPALDTRPRCPDCGDLLQHHYDDGCARCPCTTSNAEASYRLELRG